jgi:hypothetical protein
VAIQFNLLSFIAFCQMSCCVSAHSKHSSAVVLYNQSKKQPIFEEYRAQPESQPKLLLHISSRHSRAEAFLALEYLASFKTLGLISTITMCSFICRSVSNSLGQKKAQYSMSRLCRTHDLNLPSGTDGANDLSFKHSFIAWRFYISTPVL